MIKFNKYGIKVIPGDDLHFEDGHAKLFNSWAAATIYRGVNEIHGVVVEILPDGSYKFISNDTGPKVV